MTQTLVSAQSPQALLRVLGEPMWDGQSCTAAIVYIDENASGAAGPAIEVLTRVDVSGGTQVSMTVGNRYPIAEYPFINAFLSHSEDVQHYDFQVPDSGLTEPDQMRFRAPGIGSLGVIRLRKSAGQVNSYIVFLWAGSRPFSENEKTLYTQLAPVVMPLVRHHWVAAQRERTLRLTEALYEANRQLINAQNYEQILNAVFHYAGEANANVASLFAVELDETSRPLWVTNIARAGDTTGTGSPVGSRFHLPDLPFTHLWIDEPEGIVVVSDTLNDPRVDAKMNELVRQTGLRAIVVMPLKHHGQWIGLLTINWADVRSFSHFDEHFYKALSTQVATVLDNHRLRSAEQDAMSRLAQQEALYRLLAENASDMITLTTLKGFFLYVSPSCYALLGYTPEALVGTSSASLVHPDDTRELSAALAKLEANESFQSPLRMLHRDGTYKWVETMTRVVRNSADDGEYISVIRDITRRKAAEEDIARLNENLLQQAQQLVEANRELEAFTYSVSHDLRAPLRAMDGFSKILSERYRDAVPEEARRYLDRVRANAQQMGNLIDDLLKLSRIGKQSLAAHPCDMMQIAQSAFTEASDAYPSTSVHFILGDLPPNHCDSGLIKQVFVNLLTNAIKFSRNCPSPSVEIGVDGQAQGFPVYFVRDNGIGFDMQYADKAFGVFQRLHDQREYEGTGVGLALVKRIITRHGGRIWVESVPNQGTTFFFTLGENYAGSLH